MDAGPGGCLRGRGSAAAGVLGARAGGYAHGMALLSDEELRARLASLPAWRADRAGEITSEREFADFAAAIAFVDRVAELAEAADHHPDILVHGWSKVRLVLSTHSQGGVTEADLALAAQLDALDG